MKLGTLLLRDAVITLSQLEEGLRAQILSGGRLGTNLVELGFVDIDTLGRCLGRLFNLPVATPERFDDAPAAEIAGFDRALAAELTAFPLGTQPDGALAVALADPTPPTVAELHRRTGRAIAPHVAAELRLYYYLEQHYDVPRQARFLRVTDGAAPPGGRERRRTLPAGSRELPGAVRFEPKPPPRARRPSHAPVLREAHLGYLNACDAIDRARHRDEIAETLIEFASGRFEAAIVFLHREGNAIGWRGFGAPGDHTLALGDLRVPLGGASSLQGAFDSAMPFRGAPPSTGQPVERALWQALHCEPPAEVIVVPVVVRKRVVNLVYAHGFPGAPLRDDHCDELIELAIRCSKAYVRLIQATKGE